MQGLRGMPREEFSTTKTHKRKVVYQPLPSGQLKAEPGLLWKEVPHSLGKIQKPPKRSFKNEPRLSTPQSDRGTPDSLPDSGPTDEYRELRRKYLMLEEENFTLDKQSGMAEEEVKTLEDEKFALLDQLVVSEGRRRVQRDQFLASELCLRASGGTVPTLLPPCPPRSLPVARPTRRGSRLSPRTPHSRSITRSNQSVGRSGMPS